MRVFPHLSFSECCKTVRSRIYADKNFSLIIKNKAKMSSDIVCSQFIKTEAWLTFQEIILITQFYELFFRKLTFVTQNLKNCVLWEIKVYCNEYHFETRVKIPCICIEYNIFSKYIRKNGIYSPRPKYRSGKVFFLHFDHYKSLIEFTKDTVQRKIWLNLYKLWNTFFHYYILFSSKFCL